jgi:hypothetical protein
MCADPVIRLFLRVEGEAAREQLGVLGDLMTRIVRATTQEEVWRDHVMLLCIS